VIARGRLAALALASALLALAAAGCGGSAHGRESPHDVALALDFVPNPVHAPIYAAVRRGYDRANGIRLQIRPPGRGPDSLKLVLAGRATVGVLDIHDLAIAAEHGADVVGIGALVHRPLGALLAQPDVRRPRDLAGRSVGVSGLPSDPAFLRAIVGHDGGDYARIKQVTIGFKAVSALLTGRVAAVPAFWNAEGVALARRGKRIRQFRVEDYGAPAYPEVVLITSRRTLRSRRADVVATLKAIASGVRDVVAHPDAAVRQMTAVSEAPDAGLVRAQLDAVLPLFDPPLRLDRAVLERWAGWDARVGLVDRRPDVGRAFAFGLYR
jgi:NitT/TauT family transport system substrate-binding protein/putative hydroxymethylpyrimidine transport system substrate-binding protein